MIARVAISTGVWPGTIGSVATPDLLAEHAELLLRRRPLRVERRHQHLALLLVGEALGELGGGGGLAGALQPDQHDRHGRSGVQVDRDGVCAKRRDELVVHDLDDHLARLDRADDARADGLCSHPVDERLHDFERNVSLDQRTAHLAQRLTDVRFRQRTAAGDLVENAAQAV